MMTAKRKREIKQNIHHAVITAILSEIDGDEELFYALLYAQQLISNELFRFEDIFDED